jgi:hypothetical protein
MGHFRLLVLEALLYLPGQPLQEAFCLKAAAS